MPRAPRTQEAVDAFRQQILDAALKIIVEHGFDQLSMRKIAARLGVTATTIYNYYASKDELYFYIRIRGFELLYDCIEKAFQAHDDPFRKLPAVVAEYLRFGREYPDYYEVMFISRTVPKFLDCVGTSLEEVARREKDTALKPFLLIAAGIASHLGIDHGEARYLTTRLWTELNGIVSLHNSRLLHEVEDDVDGLVVRLAADICGRLRDET
ncbi:MAG TPA: TetR/AcrR family transcriptional regulator [Spirochaetota bacterium]|nr:TetR/AcrR family transcriptional regulator [Spirochaetota bacterium]